MCNAIPGFAKILYINIAMTEMQASACISLWMPRLPADWQSAYYTFTFASQKLLVRITLAYALGL